MTSPAPAPYGAWPSPLSAAQVARGALPLSFPRLVGDEVWWTEGRPSEAGRQAVVRRRLDADADAPVEDVLPAPWSARTRVHEYGGASWLAVPADGAHALVFVSFADQRLYRLDPGSDAPRPLTPAPSHPAALRYADLLLVGAEVWAVREEHAPEADAGVGVGAGSVRRALVAIPLDGAAADDGAAVRVVTGGSDFLAAPALSPDGAALAWLAWDHPRMPWDGTELRVALLRPDGTAGEPSVVLGGPAEAVLQPQWAGPSTLYAVSDRTGWWNLYRLRLSQSGASGHGDVEPEPLCAGEEEFGAPLWQLGYRTYAPLSDGRLAVLHGRGGLRLGVLDPGTGRLDDLDLPYAGWQSQLDGNGRWVVGVAVDPRRPTAVVAVDLPAASPGSAGTPIRATTVRAALAELPDPAYLPVPRAETLPGSAVNDGREVHVHVYPPTSPAAAGPAGERPPYIVQVHGGPTAHSFARLALDFAYFTSRGIGVVDVNYGGSTGYGRAYRERLRRQWGVVDVQDCVAVAQALAERGQADPERLVIRGGSAGGWTTLAALTSTDVFAAGTSYYGVAELLRFAADTHDFESRYLDGLIGVLPEDRAVYVERAPLSHVDAIGCPVLLLQGVEDRVVPPSQSQLVRDALARRGVAHAYLEFEGEAHGFRRAETVTAALEAELSFYGQVLGFEPPGVPKLPMSGAAPGPAGSEGSGSAEGAGRELSE